MLIQTFTAGAKVQVQAEKATATQVDLEAVTKAVKNFVKIRGSQAQGSS